MLEVGWSEILVIALILIIVVGPKDLPGMLRTFGRMATRVRGMANEFKGQFDQALREAELDDVRKGLSEVNKLNPTNSLRDAINPIRQLGQDIKADLQKASDMSNPAAPATAEKPAEPAVEPVAAAVAQPAAVEKIAEPAPLVQSTAETPAAAPKPAHKKAAPRETVSDAALEAAAPARKKAPVKTRDAAVAAVAAQTAVKKPAVRKKPVAANAAEAKPVKAAPRSKTVKTGDA